MVKRRFESIYNEIGLKDNDTGKEYIYFNNDFVALINRLSEENNRTDEIIDKHISFLKSLKEQKGVDVDSINQRIFALEDLKNDLWYEKWLNLPKPEFRLVNCRCVYEPYEWVGKYD